MLLIAEKLFLWFLFYSCCGWVYESILVSVQERRPVNRGFLNGPLCPIYGTGAVLGVVLLGRVHNPLWLFLLSSVGACVLEYFTSWAMERLFHARWWDYSHFKFNLNGRICLLGAVVFGIGGVVIVDGVQPYVAEITDMMPEPVIHWLCLILFVLTVLDTAITVAGIVNFEDSLDQLSAMVAKYGDAMRDRLGDAADAVSDASGKVSELVGGAVNGPLHSGREMSTELMFKVREAADGIFNRQQRRMIASFPRLRTDRNNETLQQLRETFEKLYRGRK
ncbi:MULTISPECIES: putative ABC transporter permease [Bifidobacterium]|uniref:putative ABC transporter permease n=1 Tax=Bifidobacterium TaxID=1678 RepID=UPI001BDC9D9C|nr:MULTISPECIES: putative ABC transporter permease [Bifidobacterium]MBT1161117.1 putative ABC transporter permease [Bifidobacterium sp. SO1]MBW3078191.1 putative ABC transporter permease [Bifidobacterium simiiventris]